MPSYTGTSRKAEGGGGILVVVFAGGETTKGQRADISLELLWGYKWLESDGSGTIDQWQLMGELKLTPNEALPENVSVV